MIFAKKRTFVSPEFGALFFFDEERFKNSIDNKTIAESTPIFKSALAAGDNHLKERFLQGEDIHKLVRDRSEFMDRILYYLWLQFDWGDDIALMAVGGYGRGEMHPHSDTDLLFVLRRNNPDKYRDNISDFLTFLWDLQLTIGHSVRTIRQCVTAGKADLTIMTNLLEFRTIVGPSDLGDELGRKVYSIWKNSHFFRAKRDEQIARHEKHGITEFDLEPNVKESPGGLRDIQTIHWVAKRAFKVSGLERLAGQGFYTEGEYNSLKSAETFLWRVRFGLHILTNKMHDHLQFEHQRQLAEMFGFEDSEERLAVEKFMQRYYQAATTVREINDVLIQILEESTFGSANTNVTSINERFQLRGAYIETVSPKTFKEHPSGLLEIFVILSQDKSIQGIHAETIRQIREYSHLITEDFRASKVNRRLFVELLKSPTNLSVPLQKMSRYGVLGRYLPEFGKIMGLTQHDLFHIYPVDIHTLAVVRNLRYFGLREYRKKFPISSYSYQSYSKPEILTVAGLYHDIGKGRGGDHSEIGAMEVANFARDHGFSPTEIRLMVWLVQNHLFMSRVAQREDITDPEVIANFAKHVGDETRLNLLFTLTTADILATNPTLWNNWRASLMRQLYHATRSYLKSGKHQPVDRQEIIVETKESARTQLRSKGILDDSIDLIWSKLDDNYFLRESADDVAWHTELLAESDRSQTPEVQVKPFFNYQRERATVVFVRVRKSPYLFYSVATTVENQGLSVQDARLYTTDSSSFLIVYLLDENAEPIAHDEQRTEKLVRALNRDLQIPLEDQVTRGKRTSRRLKQLPVATQTIFDRTEYQSTLEVIAADRPGLLATISEVLLKNDIYVSSAKITTLGERVEDLFVIETADGEPVSDQEFIDNVQADIRSTIDQQLQATSA